ncbi:PEP/pyruvate-binding domain-containing protein [uncultured Ilyobacter sp.]|uniref:PEP/pyruvate-binding domain-containing protein n=1 Tax=uncultured Ilyobacter sp. TaxID=544433 RepID=UPI0029F53D6A|nr:PEP/pyruvate-binding domain-containing protein [uncultured Ilyobacter sp.]
MSEQHNRVDDILRSLQERAKELNCLYRIEEIINAEELSLEDVFQGVIEAIPPGWQYPNECVARITYDQQQYAFGDFRETAWMQKATIRVYGEPTGTLEVAYLEQMPQASEGPFLKEERKLLQTIAERIGSCITHRRLLETMQSMQAPERSVRAGHEWMAILDLLRRTDQSLLMRVSRKMINHLCWSGVKAARDLLRDFHPIREGDDLEVYFESNRPRGRDTAPSPTAMADRVFDLAAAHLSDDEIISCVHNWIKQDRASFLVNTLENHHTAISEVSDAIQRYQHAGHGEVELSSSTRKGLLVSLIRRLLSDQLEYINVAKRYVEISDFHQLIQRMIYPARGHGKTGGKGAGLFLAYQIIKGHRDENEALGEIRTPKTWYLTSDGMHDFVYCNHLEDVFSQKYKEIDEVRQEYPDIVQVFKNSQFSAAILKGLSLALDDLGDKPLIVRSSSLLEDRFGAAFSGKYKSLFLANRGTKQERMEALMDAIAEVYASTFGPDPIQYRAARNLLDFQEGMGVLIQEVVGTQIGNYFLPAFAGVAFSYNEFRWSPRIKREDGLVRLVPGLGTRAVDRLGDDFPILVSPEQPGLRANATPEEVVRYSPRYMDVINLETNKFETKKVTEFLREAGDAMPAIEQLVSVFSDGHLRQPMIGSIDFGRDDVVVTFDGLLTRTPFVKQIGALLNLLQRELEHPADIEFASDGKNLYLLQCRAQAPAKFAKPAPIPRDIPQARMIFSANRYVSNGTVSNITHIVYVDPEQYGQLGSREELISVGRAVGRLNKLLPKRQFILMGPGRWGSRGDIKLGVPVTYSDINNTAMLVEIARQRGDYTPDVSFGTHFFQDLAEAEIRYLPLYPDEPDIAFNEAFLTRAPNLLAELAPEYEALRDVVHVIDVPRSADGQVLYVLMNAELDEAVAVLTDLDGLTAHDDDIGPTLTSSQERDWRWRARMAESVARRLEPKRFGVKALYVFGSTKNATAGPASDIDLLVHFVGTEEQRRDLEEWLEGWSLSLSEINYLRTGYRTDGLLDVHIVTDEDIAKRTSYAVKIGAVTDAARELPIGPASNAAK